MKKSKNMRNFQKTFKNFTIQKQNIFLKIQNFLQILIKITINTFINKTHEKILK